MFWVQFTATVLLGVSIVSFFAFSEHLTEIKATLSILSIILFGVVQFVAMIVVQFRKPSREFRIASLLLGAGSTLIAGFLFMAIVAAFAA